MNKYIIVIALGLCLAVSGFAQANQNPPQKGKRPTAGAQKAKPAAQKLDRKARTQLRVKGNKARREGRNAAAAGKAAAEKKAASDKKTAARKPGGKPAAGRGPRPPQTAAGRGPKPGGKTAAGRGPKPPQTAAAPRDIMQRRTKLFAHLFKPNKKGELITIKSITAKLARLDKNKDGRLSPKEMPAITFP